ncbi:hypothetical protein EYF80_054851 [Liparis tanakae]|uniref:Uncharacterized protein n=1 Tax=Liparis tanakae TaxID=230148 RepID=A0A4Z2F1H7_9TELE|nr:hypothetical protein EYF80_054851 [Liparis tanakae]
MAPPISVDSTAVTRKESESRVNQTKSSQAVRYGIDGLLRLAKRGGLSLTSESVMLTVVKRRRLRVQKSRRGRLGASNLKRAGLVMSNDEGFFFSVKDDLTEGGRVSAGDDPARPLMSDDRSQSARKAVADLRHMAPCFPLFGRERKRTRSSTSRSESEETLVPKMSGIKNTGTDADSI